MRLKERILLETAPELLRSVSNIYKESTFRRLGNAIPGQAAYPSREPYNSVSRTVGNAGRAAVLNTFL